MSIVTNGQLTSSLNPSPLLTPSRPLTQEVLHVAGADMQLAAAGSFLTLLQDDIVLIQTHTHSILQIVLLNLDHRDTGQHGSYKHNIRDVIRSCDDNNL